MNTIEIYLEDSKNINLSNEFDYSIENNIIRVNTKEVNKDMVKVINQIEKTSRVKDIKIINSSLEDAFLKLTN